MGKKKNHDKKPKKAKKVKAVGATPVAPPQPDYRQPHVSRILAAFSWALTAHAIVIEGPHGQTISWPCPNGWVPGWLLAHPKIGGMTADRRLRELVANGTIERRPVRRDAREGSLAEYRLVKTK